MIRITTVFSLTFLFWTSCACAVPETVSVRITDVTTSSFAVVWMTDVPATPNVELYSDAAMVNRLDDTVTVTPMPDVPQTVADAARSKGVMKVRVAGLAPAASYYVRTVTADPFHPESIGYSGLQQVTTAAKVVPYQLKEGALQGMGNDLVSFKVYLHPSENGATPGQGDLILLETPAASSPLSAFVGVGIAAPEGVLDLNNLFGLDNTSLAVLGGEKTLLSVYRGGTLSTLLHYRTLPATSSTVSPVEPVRGFFADVNLDGKVDDQDFAAFRKQYGLTPDDPTYNPDFKFVGDASGVIGVRDFVRFANEYGRTDVH